MIESKVFPKIYNRSNYVIRDIPSYHPDSIKHRLFWRTHRRRIFEGLWIPDTKEVNIDITNELDYEDLTNKVKNNWRWIPPGLYFYINFGIILHKPENAPRTMPKIKIRPTLTDIELAFFFNWIEARGFSGFKDDEEFTCNVDLLEHEKDNTTILHSSCYNSKGKLKKFIPCREYTRMLWSKPMGQALYFNQAKNLFTLGSRGSGKSYLSGVGVALHEIQTDGSKYYTEEGLKNPPHNEIFVGSGIAAKSSELLQKTKLAADFIPGTWKKGSLDERVSPLYKHMSGTLAPNNMKNPWRHEYQKKIAGEWKADGGSGSCIKHGVFTTENPEASAGGRYSVIIIEETGLTENLLTVHGSNTATQMTDGTDKYGSSLYIGTGGNIIKIVESEIIFRDPDGFDMLAFDDEWEGTGKIGWFLPATYADRKFKDSEGNTMLEEATKHYEERRRSKKNAKSSTALDMEMMNYPLVPSEMFLNKTTNNYPVADLKHRYAELVSNSKHLNGTWKGEFSITEDGETKWENKPYIPIREYPLKANSAGNTDGCVEMFYPPQRNEDGSIPYGRYISSLDPIDDDDNNDINTSLQSFFIYDLWTEKIVLEYSGRTKFAKDFYEQCRRALLYYNARMLYENQKKGVFTYFDQKNSLYLLEDTPELHTYAIYPFQQQPFELSLQKHLLALQLL